ncbi:MAG TPA: Gfo/Idh/MocA family oxidoreductase [Sumerlaeia bacterium]|nr:Gfo/Idh/MocA family oxidoreductase [Sumerlaeia bacterium]
MAERIKAVLVGCGGIAGAWLGAVSEMDDVEMVGFVDLIEESARKRAEEFGWKDAPVGTRMGEMLERTKPDVVFDCTVPEAHVQVTLEALEHGCHVLGEKPLADSMANARKMVEAARKAGRIYAVIQNRRYHEPIRRLRAFLESGAIGPVTTVNSDFYIGAHFGGFRDRMEHVLLLDMAIHTFDAARLISGRDPVAVYCKEWNPSGSWYDHDASAHAIFEMTDGVVYSYRGSWCAEGCNTSWECDWRIVGEKGSVTWDGGERFRVEVATKTGGFFSEREEREIPPLGPQARVGGHAGVIRHFLDAVKAGVEPETVCADNIKSLSMVFGAVQSAEKGQKVAIGGAV